MTSLTRGPLPAGTYWRRRAALLLTVVVLAVAVVGTLRGGGDDTGDAADVTATTAGGTPTPDPTEPAPSTGTDEGAGPEETDGAETSPEPVEPTPTREPLAEPVGRCDDADVLVEPEVVDAVAGSTVTLALGVRAEQTEACTWRMSARHLAVTLTRGGDDVWSTRQCPGAVPQQDVVARRDVTSTVTLAWDGRYSDRGCTVQRQLVEPGDLTVAAAAYGGQPSTADLELRSPDDVTSGPGTAGRSDRAPTGGPTGTPTGRPGDVPAGDPTDVASATPQT